MHTRQTCCPPHLLLSAEASSGVTVFVLTDAMLQGGEVSISMMDAWKAWESKLKVQMHT